MGIQQRRTRAAGHVRHLAAALGQRASAKVVQMLLRPVNTAAVSARGADIHLRTLALAMHT